MRNYEQVKIFDIKENGVDAKDKENLIWLVKYA